MGTPKTLREAIQNAINSSSLSEIEDALYHHIKDYLSQRFSFQMLENTDDAKMLLDLFNRITKD